MISVGSSSIVVVLADIIVNRMYVMYTGSEGKKRTTVLDAYNRKWYSIRLGEIFEVPGLMNKKY